MSFSCKWQRISGRKYTVKGSFMEGEAEGLRCLMLSKSDLILRFGYNGCITKKAHSMGASQHSLLNKVQGIPLATDIWSSCEIMRLRWVHGGYAGCYLLLAEVFQQATPYSQVIANNYKIAPCVCVSPESSLFKWKQCSCHYLLEIIKLQVQQNSALVAANHW